MSIPISLRHESWKTKHETDYSSTGSSNSSGIEESHSKTKNRHKIPVLLRVLEYLVVIKLKLVPYIDINESKFSSSM